MKKSLRMVLLTLSLFSGNTFAGLYSDDLSRCLIESSTEQDKFTLVKWMFTSMSLHPAVSDLASIADKEIDASNKAAADMFQRLMTVTCKEQAQKAVKFEGTVAIQQGFKVFGEVAGQALFSHPNVARGLAGLEKHMDTDKIQKELGISKPE